MMSLAYGNITIQYVQDHESGRWKLFGTRDDGLTAWVWSTYRDSQPKYFTKRVKRDGILGWLGFTRMKVIRALTRYQEALELDRCKRRDIDMLEVALR